MICNDGRYAKYSWPAAAPGLRPVAAIGRLAQEATAGTDITGLFSVGPTVRIISVHRFAAFLLPAGPPPRRVARWIHRRRRTSRHACRYIRRPRRSCRWASAAMIVGRLKCVASAPGTLGVPSVCSAVCTKGTQRNRFTRLSSVVLFPLSKNDRIFCDSPTSS